jgi:hypothetical protein
VNYRYEHKYLVPETLREPLRCAVEPFVRPDRHAGFRESPDIGHYVGYTIRTIYYDTSRFRNYYDNEAGVPERAKVRIRAYDEMSGGRRAFLEVKRRHGAVGSKARAPVPFDEVRALLETGDIESHVHSTAGSPDAVEHASEFLFRLRGHALRPVLLVAYAREAYVGRDLASLRVTFDGALRAEPFPELADLERPGEGRPVRRGYFVLEVKYDVGFGYPEWLRPFLGEYGLTRIAFSKYFESVFQHDIVGRYSRARSLANSRAAVLAAARCGGGARSVADRRVAGLGGR